MGAENRGVADLFFEISSLRKLWNGVFMTNSNYDQNPGNKAWVEIRRILISFGKLFYCPNPDLPERFAKNESFERNLKPESFGGDEKVISIILSSKQGPNSCLNYAKKRPIAGFFVLPSAVHWK